MENLEKWRLYLRDIESPDLYVEWGFYGMIASALQRRVWMYPDALTGLPGSFSLFPCLFVMLVGPPSTGKGRIIVQQMSIVKHRLLQRTSASGEVIPLLPYAPDTSTQEAIIEHVAGVVTGKKVKVIVDGKEQEGIYTHSSTSFWVEELEVLLRKNTEDTVNMLNKFYDSGDYHYKTKRNGEANIKNICVNIMAGTNPDAVRHLIKSRIIGTGFASRVIAVYADKPRFYRSFKGIDASQQAAYNSLVEHIKRLSEIHTEVKLSPEAQEYFDSVYETGKLLEDRINKDPHLDTYYGRKRVHWLKLSMIIHYADQVESNVISKATMEKALDALNRVEERMHEVYCAAGRNELHEVGQNVVKYLQTNGENTTYKKLWFKFSSDVRKVEFDEIVEFLIEQGIVTNNAGVITLKKRVKL